MTETDMYRAATPNAYRETAVMTASPVQLVVMLYDGAARFLRLALMAHERGTPLEAHVPLARTEAIVEELLATIDVERGGDIAPRLQGIYVFCLAQLAEARVERRPEKLQAVLTLLADLRDGWSQIAAGESA